MAPESMVEARKVLGLTQVQIAAILDVNPRTVSRWEVGKTEIPISVSRLIILLLALPEARRLCGVPETEQED